MKHFALRAYWLICFLPAVSGCAAVWGSVHLVEANKAVSSAEEAQAQELAAYEYTMAQHYLQESWERYNRSDYRASVELAKLAGDWAQKASDRVGGQDISEDIGEDIEDAPDEQEAP